MDRRIIVSFLLAIAMIGVLLVSVDLESNGEPGIPPRSEPVVVIDGPDGPIWSGTVVSEPGTAFHALMAAAELGDFAVVWSGVDGARYVSSIAGHAEGSGGWCVQVDGQDSHLSVDRFPAGDGQTVRWYWTDGQCERF